MSSNKMQKVNVITPWYQAEVDMLVKSMDDETDKTIIDSVLKENKNGKQMRNNNKRCNKGK